MTAKSAGKRARSFARLGGVSPNEHVDPSVLLLLRQRRVAAGNGMGTGLSTTAKYVRHDFCRSHDPGRCLWLDHGVKYLLAPHTSGPRDVPRCGALSLLQKDAALQGGSSRIRCRLNVKLRTSVTAWWWFFFTAESSPNPFSNLFRPSRTI